MRIYLVTQAIDLQSLHHRPTIEGGHIPAESRDHQLRIVRLLAGVHHALRTSR